MPTNKKTVLEALATIPDPELRIPITDLGLIYHVDIVNELVTVTMTLTSMGCPLFPLFEAQIKDKLRKLEGVKKVKVKLTFEPVWTIKNISKEGRTQLGIV